MIEKSLEYLDFPKVLEILRSYCATSKGKDLISLLRPSSDVGEIRSRLERTRALCETIRIHGKIPLEDISAVRAILRRLCKENSVLEPKEFLGIISFVDVCRAVQEYLRKARRKGTGTAPPYELDPLSDIYATIRRVINPEGFIEDTASPELARLRIELARLKERVKKRLEEIMQSETIGGVVQDFYITIRNGRYVIPVKPNFNQFFQGIVHDHSMTLKTSFVEPVEVVEMNNAINMLSSEIAEEERRILNKLTDLLRVQSERIEKNLKTMEEIDFFQALSLFSLEFDCVMPEVKEKGPIRIESALNPFIRLAKGEKAVPIDIILDEGKHAMIISGPNAGGKTVALKTIGLLVTMALSGLFIPAKGRPEIPLFSAVYAVVGDEQDIMSELSSFTSHMGIIRDIYGACRWRELVLIDEIGGNTDPQEASALACAIIDSFVEKGCKVVVTTHSNLLKAYGEGHEFAINVATAFDRESLTPLYFLEYGEVGLSNALETAKRLGIPEKIINRAYEYLGKAESLLSGLLLALKEERRQVEEERSELSRLKEDLREKVERIRGKKEELLRMLKERFEKKVKEVESELAEAKKEMVKAERASISRAEQRIRRLREELGIRKTTEEGIRPGDFVRIKVLDRREGHVVEEDADSYVVKIGGLMRRVRKDLVERVEGGEKKGEERLGVFVGKLRGDLNVRGMRVEEAIEEVERFVDRALALGMESVRILHGIGTGRLMNAIRNHLKAMPYVKGVRLDERNPGVTVVELR